MPDCPNCVEPILPGEATRQMRTLGAAAPMCMVDYHEECFIRMVIGSAEHQLKQCGCYGGKGEPKHLSRRECARRAFAVFQKNSARVAWALQQSAKARWN